MGGAAGPDFRIKASGEREMTQTLEGSSPAAGRTLERRVMALHRGSAIRATSLIVTGVGHRGEADAS
jgi:hypothetical protein